MTSNEIELLRLINENGTPERALMMAVTIILADLKQHESSARQDPVALRALV